MFNIANIDIQKIATAAVGALVLTTTAITAAVGPARAAETAPTAYAQTVANEAHA